MNVFVDLDNVKENIRRIKKYTSKDIIAVVKSNAYGLGANRIIKTLLKEKVNFFFFNKLKEYLSVKELLIKNNVIIFESLSVNNINKYYTNNLILTINSYDDLLRYKKIKKDIRVHLQVDTGMNRLGIRNIEECIRIIKDCPSNIKIEGIYTHYASSNDEYEYYNKQLEMFKKYLSLYNFKTIHANASSSLHKEILGNMVRVGMALYGYHSNIKLLPSVSIYTKLINIINTNKYDKVGYHNKYVSMTNEQIGVLDIGYFDSNLINKVYYNNKEYMFIGKTCMNHSYIIIDDEINLLSRLYILRKNGIINNNEYDYYKLLTSLDHIPKTYFERENYEVYHILKRANNKSRKSRT